jgi:hypothetical protein
MRRFGPRLDRAAILLAGVLCWGPTADARRVVVPATKDNTLFGPFNGAFSNGVGPSVFSGATGGFGVRRALLQFGVADSLPARAQIDSVRLRLYLNRTSSGVFTHKLHRLLHDWGAAGSRSTGGGGDFAQPGDATWSHAFYDSVTWNTPGGDFESVASAAAVVDAIGDYFWGPTPQLAADVQNWVDHPDSNFGWILIGNESIRSAKRFDSRESVSPELRPELVIDFSPPTGTEAQSWSRIKQMFRRDPATAAKKQVKR